MKRYTAAQKKEIEQKLFKTGSYYIFGCVYLKAFKAGLSFETTELRLKNEILRIDEDVEFAIKE